VIKVVLPATISWLTYGWEATYGTVSGTIDKAFGHGVRVTNLTRRNNIEKVFSAGYRNAQKLPAKKYEGAITTEFVLANPWFLRGVIGAGATTGAGPYTHTFTETDTLESFSIVNNLQTAAVRRASLLGCKAATTTITSAVNELVRVRMDTPYANEDFTTTTSGKVADSFELFTFAHGTLEAPNGTTLSMVQNVEVSIANNPELLLGQGSRFAQDAPLKNREHTGSITMALQQSSDLLEDFYGSATGPSSTDVTEVATMELVFTNGLTGTNERSFTFLYTGVQFDEESMPQDPTQVIMEDVTISMRTLTCTVINNTAAIP
jgi:hypothetical protein